MEKTLQNNRLSFLLAMDELCETRSYQEVTIDELCRAAGSSKSSFYRMFSGKVDIVLWFQELVLSQSLDEIGRTLTWQEGFMRAYEGFRIAPTAINAAMAFDGADSPVDNHLRHTIGSLSKTITEVKGRPLDEELRFEIDYFAHSLRMLLVTETWTTAYGQHDYRLMADLLARCVPRDLFDALNVPSHPEQKVPFSLSGLLRA